MGSRDAQVQQRIDARRGDEEGNHTLRLEQGGRPDGESSGVRAGRGGRGAEQRSNCVLGCRTHM